jgi:predicted dehydrogenase
MSLNTNRRKFIQTTSAVGIGSTFGFPAVLRAQNPGKKLGIAAIGAGGKGESDIGNASQDNDVVAICDADRTTLAKALAKYKLPESRGFTDFRKMLDTVKEIDACTISTPDHAHFPAAMHAIALGKHVMVQKPLVNTLWEADQLQKAAKKKGITTVMGNQGHTGEGIRVLKEWIQQGAIGKVKEIHVWTNRPIWPQGAGAKYTPMAAPANLDWAAWQAANPKSDYIDGVHPFKWRGHTLYGAGAMGDMGCHLMDGPFWATDLTVATKAEVTGVVEMGDLYWPKGSAVACNFQKEGIVLNWYEGKDAKDERFLPPVLKELIAKGAPARWDKGGNQWDWRPLGMGMVMSKGGGWMMVGDKGTIMNFGDYCEAPFIIGQEQHDAWVASNPAKTLARCTHPGNPQAEWTNAIKNGVQCGSNFDYAVPLTQLCLVGNLAMRAGKAIEWDPTNLTVKDNKDAEKFLKRTYDKGYEYSADKI